MSLRTIRFDCPPQSGVQSLHVIQGDIVEVQGENINGWTWSKKPNTDLFRYVPTQALGPFPAPQLPEQIGTPLGLELNRVNPSPTVESEVKSFFSQFGDIYYFDSRSPNGTFSTYRFALDILSTKDFDTIKSSLVNQPFYTQDVQFNLSSYRINPLAGI
ncbi:hypothetical protein BLNAU_10986 [Blattamonas nauphoetae]|uniref:SH3 domain-containing protein n=1 Tax=Blattamonas nauphoetae TaxID=2049346 RepID=A0ABQ9XNQ7_9EUKA|nr:hypothetical protein BLNAU_10986 [Blattamonas nauphoetae]